MGAGQQRVVDMVGHKTVRKYVNEPKTVMRGGNRAQNNGESWQQDMKLSGNYGTEHGTVKRNGNRAWNSEERQEQDMKQWEDIGAGNETVGRYGGMA